MHFYRIQLLLSVLLTLLLCGCNSDIFVDRVTDPESSFTIDGNLGTHELRITKKGITDISFENDVDYDAEVEMYGNDGERIYHISSVNDVSKILYNSKRFAIQFEISGNDITVTALDNTYTSIIKIWVSLYYGPLVKTIEISVTPGLPLEIHELSFSTSIKPGTSIITGIPHKFHNNNESPIHFIVYPYKEAKSRLELRYDDDWAYEATGTVNLPIYRNDKWELSPVDNIKEITLSPSTYYYAENTDTLTTKTIAVPPLSTVETVMKVTYATLQTYFFADVQLPNSQLSWIVSGDCLISQPIDYKIDVKCYEN